MCTTHYKKFQYKTYSFLQCTYLQFFQFYFLGVFVITHISTCRNGAGYCILGFSCEVDKDFTKDDLGGHCSGLGAAFNPKGIYIRFALHIQLCLDSRDLTASVDIDECI